MAGKTYGFNCGYCSSRLEANDQMGGSEGQCPTCGNTIMIPVLDRLGRLIDPRTQKIIKPDPHPVHAYAAAGERAPTIIREDESRQTIRCPRCQRISQITANNCAGCGMPFTMEGTTSEADGMANGTAVAALVTGLLSLPFGILIVPPILAMVFGVVGFNIATRTGRGAGMSIAGAILGFIGLMEPIYKMLH